jgi:O-antigen ligase
VAVFVFAVWNAVSVFWSADAGKTMTHILTWTQTLVFVYILWDLYTTRAALLAGLQAFILGEFVVVGTAVVNFLSGREFYAHEERFSAAAEINPDGFAFIVVLGVPIAWYLAISDSESRSGRLLRILNCAYVPIALLGIALSGTRTALIAAIPGMLFGLASLTRTRVSKRLAIFLFVGLSVLALTPYVDSLPSFQRLGTTASALADGDFQGRADIWRQGLASFQEHPLLGVGSNMYRSINNLHKVAHNSFLSVLVEVGLVGFTLFGLILVITIVQAMGQTRWDSRLWMTVLLVWAIGASSLTWEHRKTTWLFMSLVAVSATLHGANRNGVPSALPHEGSDLINA